MAVLRVRLGITEEKFGVDESSSRVGVKDTALQAKTRVFTNVWPEVTITDNTLLEMGFKSVYKCLQEIFPKVDSCLLRAVAIENFKDADQAVDVVLKEIIPYLSSQFGGPVNPQEDFLTSVSPPKDNEFESKDQVVLLRQQQRIVDKTDVGLSSELRSIASDGAKVTEDIGGALHVDSTPLLFATWIRKVLEIGVLTWSLATAFVPLLAGFMPGLILLRILIRIGEGVSPSAATDLIARHV
ncbi:hypothetical protein SO802_032007 [Lithocarpus litseifolius]|uniref:CUE domain-containing protein n=1 Tax=Lithocarpus litseifolius TaxID=425828 RepID=A0AAW2BNW9_9ROSI